jgi:hypothetical protein
LPLQALEPFCKQIGADPWQPIDKVFKSAGPGQQLTDNKQRPAFSDEI